MKTPTESWLSPLIRRYLDLKQALGRGFAIERRVLETLAEVVATAAAADLTQSEFEHWCKTQTHLTTGVRRNRMRIVRNFCLYRRRTERIASSLTWTAFRTPTSRSSPTSFRKPRSSTCCRHPSSCIRWRDAHSVVGSFA